MYFTYKSSFTGGGIRVQIWSPFSLVHYLAVLGLLMVLFHLRAQADDLVQVHISREILTKLDFPLHCPVLTS